MRYPAAPARTASCAMWSAPMSTMSSRRCAAISIATVLRTSMSSWAARSFFKASRLDPADPWVQWAKLSLERTTGQAADHPAQSRRLAAERYFRRHSAAENHLGAALLRRLLAARAERAFAGADRPRGLGADGRTVLGPWRSRDAAAAARRLSFTRRQRPPLFVARRAPSRGGCARLAKCRRAQRRRR